MIIIIFLVAALLIKSYFFSFLVTHFGLRSHSRSHSVFYGISRNKISNNLFLLCFSADALLMLLASGRSTAVRLQFPSEFISLEFITAAATFLLVCHVALCA